MNSIRPLISYSELLAARQHTNLLLEDLRQDLIIEQIKKPIRKKIIKEFEENINSTKELIDKIDKVFIKQAILIEFQIDINYPQL